MYFLIDQNSDRIKAAYKSISDTVVNGFKVVRVPVDTKVDTNTTPFTETELQDQKFNGLLAKYRDFSYIVFDDLDDASQWDMGASGVRGAVGNNTAWISPDSGTPGRLQTHILDVSADGSFRDFAVYWDVYRLQKTDAPNTAGILSEITYLPEMPDSINVSISNDGGSTFTAVTHLEHIELAALGNQLVLRFENIDPASRYYIGGFAILY